MVSMELADREDQTADMVLAGIGVPSDVELIRNTQLAIDDAILVNRFLETNVDGVFADGAVARYRDQIFGRFRRVEHWDKTVTKGRHVARTILGQWEPYIYLPYFFSNVSLTESLNYKPSY